VFKNTDSVFCTINKQDLVKMFEQVNNLQTLIKQHYNNDQLNLVVDQIV